MIRIIGALLYAVMLPQTVTPPIPPPPIDATPNCNGVPTLVPGMLPSGSWWSSCGVCYPTQAPTGWPTNEWNTPFPVCKYPTPSTPNKFVSPKAVDPGDDGGAGWCAYCPGDPACVPTATPTITTTPTYAYTPTSVNYANHTYIMEWHRTIVVPFGTSDTNLGEVIKCPGTDQLYGTYIVDTNNTTEYLPDYRVKFRWAASPWANNWFSPKQWIFRQMAFSRNGYCKINGVQCNETNIQQEFSRLMGQSVGYDQIGADYIDNSGMDFLYGYQKDDLGNKNYTVSSTFDLYLMCGGVNQPTPTPAPTQAPTPTPTPTQASISVCSYPEYIASDPLAWFDDIEVYPGACITVVNGIDETSINGDIHLVIPTITFCPIYVDIPPFEFMGISIPVAMFLLPIVAFVIRLISRI